MQIYKYYAKLPKILKISGKKIFSQTLLSKTTPTPLEKVIFSGKNSCKQLSAPIWAFDREGSREGGYGVPHRGGYGGLTFCQSLFSVSLSADFCGVFHTQWCCRIH